MELFMGLTTVLAIDVRGFLWVMELNVDAGNHIISVRESHANSITSCY